MGKELPDVANLEDNGVLSSLPAAGAFVEGLSPGMRAVGAVIRELAQSEVPVLLLAEKGAGKHATARWIHEMSRRSTQPFRALVCSTLKVEDLGSSGENGEFKQDLFQEGTIFLDEIADLSLEGQARIMEVLPRAENARSGNHGSSPAESARLICGSERDLELEVKAGRSARGSLLPDQRGLSALTSPAPAAGGYSSAGRALSGKVCAGFSASRAPVECGGAAAVPRLFLAGKRTGTGECGESDSGAGRRRRCHGRVAISVEPARRRRQRDAGIAQAGSSRGVARGRERIDFEGSDPHPLEPAARGAGVTDQLQGPAVQDETNWMQRIRIFLAAWRDERWG